MILLTWQSSCIMAQYTVKKHPSLSFKQTYIHYACYTEARLTHVQAAVLSESVTIYQYLFCEFLTFL